MDNLVKRLERNSGWRNERWQCVTDPALLTEAAARITELETALAEAEGRVKNQIVNAIKTHQNFGDEDLGPGLDLAIDIATGSGRSEMRA